jgi:hypothetical protein
MMPYTVTRPCPCSQADGADVPASKAYKAGIQAAEAKGIRTLLAIGGYVVRLLPFLLAARAAP